MGLLRHEIGWVFLLAVLRDIVTAFGAMLARGASVGGMAENHGYTFSVG